MRAGFPGSGACLQSGSALLSLSVSIRLPAEAWRQEKMKSFNCNQVLFSVAFGRTGSVFLEYAQAVISIFF